jgi:archaeal type IV pilus assembly protein PilA
MTQTTSAQKPDPMTTIARYTIALILISAGLAWTLAGFAYTIRTMILAGILCLAASAYFANPLVTRHRGMTPVLTFVPVRVRSLRTAHDQARQKVIDDDGVSPVIAVILMVAITVVLAAVVYVWVSGFGTTGSLQAFPRIVMTDAPTDLTAVSGEDVLLLSHRGGDTIDWTRYAVTMVDADDVDLGLESPTGVFSVGDRTMIIEGDDDVESGTAITLRIIDTEASTIVFENTIVVT